MSSKLSLRLSRFVENPQNRNNWRFIGYLEVFSGSPKYRLNVFSVSPIFSCTGDL